MRYGIDIPQLDRLVCKKTKGPLLELEGSVVTIDAMGTQKDIAEKIVEAGADYILTVKGNQETLLEDVKALCGYERPAAEDTDVDKGRGRMEECLCQAFEPDAIIRADHKGWPGLKTVVKVRATRIVDGEQSTEERFYISSLPAGSPFNTYIRSHWEVENKLHWTLDMTFGEDRQRKRSRMAAQNFSILTKFALNLLKKTSPRPASETNASRPLGTGTSSCTYYKFDAFALVSPSVMPFAGRNRFFTSISTVPCVRVRILSLARSMALREGSISITLRSH